MNDDVGRIDLRAELVDGGNKRGSTEWSGGSKRDGERQAPTCAGVVGGPLHLDVSILATGHVTNFRAEQVVEPQIGRRMDGSRAIKDENAFHFQLGRGRRRYTRMVRLQ